MKHFRIKRAVGLLLGICLFCQLLMGLASCGTREDIAPVTAITSVELNKSGERVSVSATLSEDDAALYKNGTICLFALEPFQTLDMAQSDQLEPVAESRGAESMHFTVDFVFQSGTRNRLTQRFLLASRDENGVYAPLTDGVYISNPEVLAEGSVTTDSDTLKGVAISAFDDVSSLSPSHTVIDLPLEQYIQSIPKKGDTLSYLYAGETLSLSETAVEALDEQVRSLAAQGSLIYLRPVLTTSPDTLEELSVLGYTGASEAQAYALNLETEEGYFYISGFFSFLAQRYASVSGVIPGVSLNDARYSSSTVADFEIYVNNTIALMRMVHNIFRAKRAGVQVYLPVSNLFTTDRTLGATERGSREFLGAFATYAKRAGDFDWSIYLLMETPSETADTIYTESGTVNDGSVTEKYIFPQTLPLLLDLLSTQELVCGSEKRQMIWALSLAGDGDGGKENQRVSLLYTYMKAIAHNADKTGANVRAVIWETLSDTETSADGLMTADGALKPAGELFRALGRADLSSAVDLSGIEAKLGTRYAEISAVLSDEAENVTVYEGVATTDQTQIPDNSQSTLIFGEDAGWGNSFSALPGTGVVTIRRPSYDAAPMLSAIFESDIGCGVYTGALSGGSLQGRNKFALTLTAALPEGYTSAEVRVTLEGVADGRNLCYTGEGRVNGGNGTTLIFDVEDFAKKIDNDGSVTMTVALLGAGATAETPVTLCLSKVESFETRNWFVRGGWILFLVVVILIALTVLLIWFFQTYEVRWTPNRDRGKRQKTQGVPMRERLAKLWADILDRMQIRPRSRSRIMVKSDTAQNRISDSNEKGFDDEDDDVGDAEELEELFDGDADDDEDDEIDSSDGSDGSKREE